MTKILWTIVVILHATLLFGQIEIGVKSGYTNAWLQLNEPPPSSDIQPSVNGWHINGILYYSLFKRISIGTEPGYIERGSGYIPNSNTEISHIQQQTQNITLPFFVKAEKPLINNLSILGKIGYSPSFTVSAQHIITYSANNCEIETENINMNNGTLIERWDSGLHLGFGIFHSTKIGKFQLEFEYYIGQKNVIPQHSSKNRNLNIGLAYLSHFW